MKQVRQGDFLLVKINYIPPTIFLEKEDHPKGEVIVGLGEMTGHMHRIKSFQAEAWRGSGGRGRYLTLKEPAELTHDEHGAIKLEAGNYQIVQQREWTAKAIHNVED